jgi:hypothetical protein
MTSEQTLLALAEYWRTNRQVGHTTAMMAGAGNVDAIVVCANEHNKDAIRAVADRTCSRMPTLVSVGEVARLRTAHAPLVVDHHALVVLIEGVHKEIETLRDELASMRVPGKANA